MSDIFRRKNVSVAGRNGGFTLIELMVTIVIAAILVGIALPSFREMTISANITQTTNQLLAEFNLAKSEATRRGTLVAVISNSGTNNWTSGWYVETDGDFAANGTFAGPAPPATSKDVVLRTNPGISGNNYSITTALTNAACTSTVSRSAGVVIFNGQGNQPCNVGAFDINICRPDSKPARSKRITIATSGMVTTRTDTSGSPAPPC